MNFAATRRINPPGVTPVLTEEQVWKGLGIKAREPMTFVPIIKSCQIVKDDGNKVGRSSLQNSCHESHLSSSPGPSDSATQSLWMSMSNYMRLPSSVHLSRVLHRLGIDSWQAYFEIPSSNTRITNAISYDTNDELLLTFTFAGNVPGVKPGTPKKEVNKLVGSGVEHTIKRLRELAQEGKL